MSNSKATQVEWTGTLELLSTDPDKAGPTPLRTSTIKGTWFAEPISGRPFQIWGASLTPGMDRRLVQTSLVRNVERDGAAWVFRTLNSTYRLTVAS